MTASSGKVLSHWGYLHIYPHHIASLFSLTFLVLKGIGFLREANSLILEKPYYIKSSNYSSVLMIIKSLYFFILIIMKTNSGLKFKNKYQLIQISHFDYLLTFMFNSIKIH